MPLFQFINLDPSYQRAWLFESKNDIIAPFFIFFTGSVQALTNFFFFGVGDIVIETHYNFRKITRFSS